MRGPDLFIHRPPKNDPKLTARSVMLNVVLTAETELPYVLDSGMRKMLQVYTELRATCITTPAATISHLLVTFWAAACLVTWLLFTRSALCPYQALPRRLPGSVRY